MGLSRKKLMGTRFMPVSMGTSSAPAGQRFAAEELLRIPSPSTDKAKAGNDLCKWGSSFRALPSAVRMHQPSISLGRIYVPWQLKSHYWHISKESSRKGGMRLLSRWKKDDTEMFVIAGYRWLLSSPEFIAKSSKGI